MTILEANNFIEQNRSKVNETYRNKFHLMAPVGWMNDPNGFIYFRGQYHLFYQFYPYDSIWGPMHWGHSVSDDGVSWKELPTALAPDQPYDKDGCFSGTAYVEDDVLYLMYTGHVVTDGKAKQVQCIAKSSDGIVFEKSDANPLIYEKHIEGICSIEDFRDPKLFKREDVYYSIVAAKTFDNRGQFIIFQSSDLITWSKGSVFLEGNEEHGVMWECPDYFELDGKDVIIMSPIQMKSQGNKFTNISSTLAMVGTVDWDQLKFNLEYTDEIDGGQDFYAPQSVLNSKGERMMIAWMQMWDRNIVPNTEGHLWSGSMTLPRVINIENGKFVQRPIEGIYNHLNIETLNLKSPMTITKDLNYLKINTDVTNFDIKLVCDDEEFVELSLSGGYLKLGREFAGHKIVGSEGEDYTSRTLEVGTGNLELEIFIDTSSIEVFVNEDDTMTTTFYKKKENRHTLISGLTPDSTIKLGTLK